MNLPPPAVLTAYHFAREMRPETLAFMCRFVSEEVDWATDAERVYARARYDLALRIAQQPLHGPELPAGVGY